MKTKPLVLKHPGEVVRDEFIESLGLSVAGVARATGIPQPSLAQMMNGRRALSPESCLRLARYFGVDPQWFMNLQAHYDLRQAEKRIARSVASIKPMVIPSAAT